MITARLLLALQAIPSAPLAHADIVFDAKATVADFRGVARTATGAVLGADSLAGVRGWVEVKWRDIDTKNRTRNRHMLETVDEAEFPTIRLELEAVTHVDASADSAAVVVRGMLSMHGVSRAVEWPATVRLYPESVTVASVFPVDMRDWGIKPPVRLIIARMGAVVMVRVRLVFVREVGSGEW